MAKELQKKVKNEVAVNSMSEVIGFEEGDNWGAGSNIDNDDIILPKILLMQQISELVEGEKARSGDLVNSLTEAVIGKDVDFIVFDTFKTMQTYVNDKYESTDNYTPDMAKLPYEEAVPEGKLTRSIIINYYVLLAKDVEEGVPLPMVISFRRTSAKAGKKLASMLKILDMFKKPSAAKVYKLGSKQEESDKGKYNVLTVEEVRNSTREEVDIARSMYEALASKKDKVKVHDTDKVKKEEAAGEEVEGNNDIPF